MEYRSEQKYLVKKSQLQTLGIRMKSILRPDENMIGTGKSAYNIRSIYFDTYDDWFVRENEAGINERHKIRIRIYNRSPELIRMEIKHKKNGMTRKESCRIDETLCRRLMAGECLTLAECGGNPVLNRVYLEMKLHLLRPRVIVEYERTAFVGKAGNVRVTFDENIRCCERIERFFEDSIYSLPVLAPGTHILEVKYDEVLPGYVSQSLELNTLSQTSFSKYYLARTAYEEYQAAR